MAQDSQAGQVKARVKPSRLLVQLVETAVFRSYLMLLFYGQARLNEFATILKTYVRSVLWIVAPLHNGK